MTLEDHWAMEKKAMAAVKLVYPDAAYVESQSDGDSDPNAVIVVYRRKEDKRLKNGYRLVPIGACRMDVAAAGDTTLHHTLRGWCGK